MCIVHYVLEFSLYTVYNRITDKLGLNKTVDKTARANGVRWFEHVLKIEDDDVLRKALKFEMDGQRKRGQLKRSLRRKMEDIRKTGLKREDAHDQKKNRSSQHGQTGHLH